jgi:hypothetical protein
VFCEGVQHRLRFCLHHLSCVKMETFQFHLHTGKRTKFGWVGVNSHDVLITNSVFEREVWDGTLSWCKSQFFCHQSSERSLRTCSQICTQFDAVPLSGPSRNRITSDTRLQIKGRKEWANAPKLRVLLYTDPKNMLILPSTVTSRYYNCCKYDDNNPRNYGYSPCMKLAYVIFCFRFALLVRKANKTEYNLKAITIFA